VIRIGHRGAAALAPENTIEAMRTAVALGVDLAEFDVLADAEDVLVLAHSRHELPAERATLDDALAYLAETRVGAHVDLKQRGLEPRLAAALRRHGLVERSLVSSLDWAALRDLRTEEPRLAVGLSYPEDRYGVAGRPTLAPLLAGGLLALRRVVPALVPRWLARAGASALVLHHQLVTPAAIARCHGLGAAVWSWTVNDASTAARLSEWGVDAIITDDPRILAGSGT